MSPASLNNRLDILSDRAQMLQKARLFFHERQIIEVDCPLVTSMASIDLHIDLFPVQCTSSTRYLHTSPEYAMKRLLVEGFSDIYQLGHVFRSEEVGERHNPEFTMAEWYRLDFTYDEMIEETADFIRLFLGNDLPLTKIGYADAMVKFAGIDPNLASLDEMEESLLKYGHNPYPSAKAEGTDALLNLICALIVEPKLAEIPGLVALCDYPPSQAALARLINRNGRVVAKRFEIYSGGVELANGYHELCNANEQKNRFDFTNEQRMEHGKEPLPIDSFFLQALEKGLPDCCGVAVGFDRLMMVRHQTNQIDDILPFSWKRI